MHSGCPASVCYLGLPASDSTLFPSLGARFPVGSALTQPQPGVLPTSPTCTRCEAEGVITHFHSTHVSSSPFSLDASKTSDASKTTCPSDVPSVPTQRGDLRPRRCSPSVPRQRRGLAADWPCGWRLVSANVPKGEGRAPLRWQRWTGLHWARAWARLLLQK